MFCVERALASAGSGHACPLILTMGKKINAAPQPLSGIRVLVGRARHQAGALSGELRALGAQVVEIPFIEIRKPKSFQPLDSALKNLDAYDWLILTSVNGVEAMGERLDKIQKGLDSSAELRASFGRGVRRSQSRIGDEVMRIAAIGPATKKAIEQRGGEVDVVPKEYVAESVVRSLRRKVKGKRVLLVRAKVARDVIPRELRKAGAQVDVVEAYQTVVPEASRVRLRTALENSKKRPHVLTFTSSSTVKNFVELLGEKRSARRRQALLAGILMASIGPVTSSTLREVGLPVDVEAKKFTIPGLVQAIVNAVAAPRTR